MSDITDARLLRAERRRKGFLAFGAAIVVAALLYGAWWLFSGRFSEATDDAYVAGNIVAVSSRENATVTTLYADNTQAVRQGQLLIEMDPSVAEVNMRAAEANLARAARGVRGTFASADFYRRNWNRLRSPWHRPEATISGVKRHYPARCRAKSWAMPAMRWRRRRRLSILRAAGWPRHAPALPGSMWRTIPMCWRPKRSCAPRPSRWRI